MSDAILGDPGFLGFSALLFALAWLCVCFAILLLLEDDLFSKVAIVPIALVFALFCGLLSYEMLSAVMGWEDSLMERPDD